MASVAAPPAPATPSATLLPPALLQAYRQAWYGVWLPAPDTQPSDTPDTSASHPGPPGTLCVLQVDVAQPQLLHAMRGLHARHACLLTACNPEGRLLSAAENAQRMQALRTALHAADWSWAPALGRDPQGQWPGEDSLLVWHMDRAQARQWGRQWAQNAVLWMGDDAIPRLECLR